ncbi:phosphoribosylamine--glycine ligase [Gammaproteobacteria bacterium]|nr:phosphoribosylamine--glycine ligase [Gammaproteobacteria bacterium]
MMKYLIVGSGAREHAIIKALKKYNPNLDIICFGTNKNPGIINLNVECFVGDICNISEVLNKSIEWKIDIAVIGPEAPLEKGLADILWENSIAVIGPKKQLAKLETSKSFTRDLLKKYDIPGSPKYKYFNDLDGVISFLEKLGNGNFVIKADGLMGGKGVKVAGDHLHSINEAYDFCKTLSNSNNGFVIEEKVIGEEFSLLYFCDGSSLIPMPIVQDHKRAYENDKGPNTGGMGSYSDANHSLPFLSKKDLEQAKHINEMVISAITKEFRQKYIGILYSSFMVTKDGLKLIEYNVRFGDPEALNVLSILKSDLSKIFEAMISGHLAPSLVEFENFATVCKYAVPDGYPDNPIKNSPIDLSNVDLKDNLYFASVDDNLNLLGSRAVASIGVANNIADAEKTAEYTISQIKGKIYHRSDIGTKKLIEKRINNMQEIRS